MFGVGMRRLVIIVAIFCNGSAWAQWAVLDQKVLEIVTRINKTDGAGSALTKFLEQEKIDKDFDSVTLTNPEKYIGTTADCGDKNLNENHFKACLGLRNLRIKTLEQTYDIIEKIKTRKQEIETVVNAGTGKEDAGKLQKQQFILQGLQANMQNDAMELEAVRYGYQQRASLYEMQMAEARRATDTRAAPGPGGLKITLPVPFPGK
jgi:hypothetical protein